MNEKKWNEVRQFYMNSFGIAPELVDLMASNDILLMCVSGSSNSAISKLLNIDEDAIKEIVSTILNFDGWTTDLDFNPYKIYQEDPSFISFVGCIAEMNNPEVTIDMIKVMHLSCIIYSEIEELLENGWK